jgi:hypothetical protein
MFQAAGDPELAGMADEVVALRDGRVVSHTGQTR